MKNINSGKNQYNSQEMELESWSGESYYYLFDWSFCKTLQGLLLVILTWWLSHYCMITQTLNDNIHGALVTAGSKRLLLKETKERK